MMREGGKWTHDPQFERYTPVYVTLGSVQVFVAVHKESLEPVCCAARATPFCVMGVQFSFMAVSIAFSPTALLLPEERSNRAGVGPLDVTGAGTETVSISITKKCSIHKMVCG